MAFMSEISGVPAMGAPERMETVERKPRRETRRQRMARERGESSDNSA